MRVARVLVVAQLLFQCFILITCDINFEDWGHLRRPKDSRPLIPTRIDQDSKDMDIQPPKIADGYHGYRKSPGGGLSLSPLHHVNGTTIYNRCPAGFMSYFGTPSSRNIVMGNSNCVMPCR